MEMLFTQGGQGCQGLCNCPQLMGSTLYLSLLREDMQSLGTHLKDKLITYAAWEKVSLPG